MMKLSDRAWKVRSAKSRIKMDLDNLQEQHDLTDIEMLQTLHEWSELKLKYMLRVERHGDPEKEADLDHTGLEI
jgi:hypothetical protein